MSFTPQTPARVRNDPLGPQTVNIAQQNIVEIDGVALAEHLNDGQHNAMEIPWLLGHVEDGATPAGSLFNTTYGGGTLARPATGAYAINVAAGVISTSALSQLQLSAMANVSDPAVESKPHTITFEAISATSVKVRIRELSSALGAGNAWADANRDFDFGLHALAQDTDSLLTTPLLKVRRDTLTDQATDWNALVVNQGITRKAALLEHTTAGLHSVNRIAKAIGWFRPSAGPAFSITASERVASVTRVSSGVVEVLLSDDLAATTNMACFCEPQPASLDELVITNGRAFNAGAGVTKFRFYTYIYSGGAWARGDRPFFAAMFGAP